MKAYSHRLVTLLLLFALIAPLLPPSPRAYSQTLISPAINIDATVTITFDGQRFTPAELTIKAGTAIIWLNQSNTDYVMEGSLENRLYLPLVRSAAQFDLTASDQAMTSLSPADYIIFTEPFRANSTVTYTPTGTGELTYNLIGLATTGGMIHILAANADLPAPTLTATAVPTITPTPSFTMTATATATPTPSAMLTNTPMATATDMPTSTATSTVTPTTTPTLTDTPLPTVTATATPSPTVSPTATVTSTPTVTPTATAEPTVTPSFTPAVTPTASPTYTPTSTATATTSDVATPTPTMAPTDTATAIPTATPTSTETSTATFTPLPTATGTDTPTHTPTNTPMLTATATETTLPTASTTATPSPTASPTQTPTDTSTATATDTPTVTPGDTPTPTASPTSTTDPSTPTLTPTPLASPTSEPPPTPTTVSSGRLSIVAVPSTIVSDTTWRAGTVYLVSGLTTLNSGVTLTIEAGAVVKFQLNNTTRGRLVINGILVAQGSAELPITLTSIHDDQVGGDTNTNGGGTWPQAGDWDGLTFASTSGGSSLEHVQVLYGGTTATESGAAITVKGASVNVTNSTVRYSAGDGLRWFNGATGAISGNEISNHLSSGLFIKESSTPTIQDNVITHNRLSAVYLEGNSFPSFADNRAYGNFTNGISVYGTVGTGQWYADMSYIATQDLIIEFGNTLTLAPGVVVKFSDNQDLIVRGALVASGTVSQTIVFTSLKDDAAGGDTKQDGSATKPVPGDWGALYFADTSDDATSILDHVVVRYGGDAYSYGAGTAYTNLALDSASPTIRNSTFAASARYGVQLLNVSSPSFQQNTMQDNVDHGLWISPSSAPQVQQNTFLRNSGYAIYVTGSSQAQFSGNQAQGNRVNGIGMTGTLNADTTWEADLPYVLESSLTLDLNTTLTMQPGVIVKLATNARFTINGVLQAVGNSSQPIRFTSLKDDSLGGDTNGDGIGSKPAPGDWDTLRFASTSGSSSLDYTTIRYGGSQNTTGALFLDGSAPTLGHLTVMGSLYRGLYIQNASPFLENLTVSANAIGLYNGPNAFTVVRNSNIYSNTQQGLYNGNSSYTFNAADNWWGHDTGPRHSSNPAGQGDQVSGLVTFAPWQTAPLGSPVVSLPTFPLPPVYTTVSGIIAANTSWTVAQSPYLVTADVTVNPGVQLTIEPGVVVKFATAANLNVLGILNAQGTSAQHIYFTSRKDDSVGGDTNSDGASTWPQAGDWGRISFSDSIVDSLTIIRYAEVRYGNTPLSIDSAAPRIEDNLITNNAGYGISWRNNATPQVRHNQILDNTGGGISLSSTAAGTIADNQFWGNGGYAIYLDASCYPTLSGNTAHYNEINGVRVSGAVTFNQRWHADLPYVVEGTVTINNGPALTVAPGAVVKFKDSSSELVVNGALVADGTETAPITFTSLRDDTYGGDTDNDDGIYAPAPGNWGRITFADTSDDSRNLLRYVVVRYGSGQSLNVTSAAPRVISSTIAYANGSGIYLNSQANPRLEGNTLLQNGSDGIYITGSSAPALVNNQLIGNGRYAVYFSAESKPTFSGNGAVDNRYNAAAVSGTLAGATTWQADLTYLVVNNLTLPSGAKLTIQPGAVVKFLATFGMTINGQLLADAPVDESAPIVFTSLLDDAHGGDTDNDHGVYTPAPGDWGTLLFNSTSVNSSITHAQVRFGGSPVVKVDGTAVNFEGNVFYHNTGGIDFRTATQTGLPINNNRFDANRHYAVWLKFADYTIIKANNAFLNNIGNAIKIFGSGLLTQNTELLSGTVYWLDSWTVSKTVTLTIPSDVVLKFNSGQALTIQGKLVASGTITNPVIFTSIHQDLYGGDTNYNNNATTPAPGDWTGIVFVDSADDTSLLKHVTIEYAGQGQGLCLPGCTTYYYTNLLFYKASPTIDHATIRYGYRQGIHAYESNFRLSNSVVQENGSTALYLTNNASPTISDNTISDNNGHGVHTSWPAGLPVITGNTFADNANYALNIRAEAVQLAAGNTYGGSDTHNTISVQGGTITSSGTWRNEGATYLIAGLVTVNHESNPTLTIAPGNTLKFTPGTRLWIETGKLIADGTTAPILFTSSATTPAPGDWTGIVFVDSADDTSLLKHVTIEYAGQAQGLCLPGCYSYYYTNLLLYKASPTIDHATIRYAHSQGIHAYESNFHLSNSVVQNNGSTALYLTNNASPTIADNTIRNNNGHGVYTSGSASLPVITGNTFADNAYSALNIRAEAVQLAADNTYSGSATNNTIYVQGGTITSSGIWRNEGATYRIAGLITVNHESNPTLTIAPGNTLKFTSGTRLWIETGKLVADGTTAPILFTSSATTPAPGDWTGIVFVDSADDTSLLKHVTIEYAGQAQGLCLPGCYSYYYTNLLLYKASPTIDHATIRYAHSQGIHAYESNAVVQNSNIYANANYGLYNGTSGATYQIHAENNWWGSDSGPAPYGSGNGINYQTCTDPVTKITYICQFYVDADPWIGKQTFIRGQLGTNSPAAANQAWEADPVNTATGNYAYSYTDLAIATRGWPLNFTRAYNALDPQPGPLGWGWTQSWHIYLTQDADGSVVVTFGDGHGEKWTLSGNSYVGAPGVHGVLIKNGDGSFDLTPKDQSRYHFAASGRLAYVEDKNGNRTTLSYDSQDRLLTITEPAGRALTLAYTSPISPSLITGLQDPLGRAITLTYNITGDLTAVTGVTGDTTTMHYDGHHRLLTQTDANGHTFNTNLYDSQGRVVEQWDGGGQRWTFVYDDLARTTVVTDPLGRKTTYTYDGERRLVTEKDALNGSVSYGYDGDHNRIQMVDKRGNTTRLAYDDRGNMLVITDTLGFVTRQTFDARNNLLSRTDALSNMTTFTYDANANLLASADALHNTTTWAYTAQGQLAQVVDARGYTTAYTYDANGYPATVTDALGHSTTFAYDNGGRLQQETDALGRVTTYTYDNANRILTVSAPLGQIITNTYDAVGNRLTSAEPEGGITSFTYDEKDRLIRTTNALGHSTTYGYDAVNNRISVTDPLSHTTTYVYDALNRLITVGDPLGQQTHYGYDANGNRTRLTDANNRITTYGYDARNLLTQVTDAAGGTVAYTYDANGNRAQMTDANGHRTSYSYDALNRVSQVTDPLHYTTAYGYDATGNRVSMTKADGALITYSYDALNRLVENNAPGNVIHYAYDAVANRTAMTDTTGVTTYGYDDLDRLVQVTNANNTLAYSYDRNSNRTSVTYPGGAQVLYTYDVANRLTTVADWDGRSTSYSYDAAGRQSQVTYPNGVQATNSYDAANRLLSLVNSHPTHGTLATATYTLDAVGNRLAMQDDDGLHQYSYDPLYRLTVVSYPDDETVNYAYDPMGNRMAMTSTVQGVTTYLYDAGDRLLSYTKASDTTTLTWDANGNMTGKGSATYTFDARDRLTQVVSGTTTVAFAYNGDGVRLGKTVDGVTTTYLQDVAAPLPVVLVETTGGQSSRYVYGNDLLTLVDDTNTPSFYHYDGLGSTRALSSQIGQWNNKYSYDAFGFLRGSTQTVQQPFKFSGEQNDEWELIYLRERYYDPELGRFMTKDSMLGFMQDNQTRNRYIYVLNNPTNYIDPTGKMAQYISSRAALFLGVGGSAEYRRYNDWGSGQQWNLLTVGIGGGVGGGFSVESGLTTGGVPNSGIDFRGTTGLEAPIGGVSATGKYDPIAGKSSVGGSLDVAKGEISSDGNSTIATKIPFIKLETEASGTFNVRIRYRDGQLGDWLWENTPAYVGWGQKYYDRQLADIRSYHQARMSEIERMQLPQSFNSSTVSIGMPPSRSK